MSKFDNGVARQETTTRSETTPAVVRVSVRPNPFETLLQAARTKSLERMAQKAREGSNCRIAPPLKNDLEPPDWATHFPTYVTETPNVIAEPFDSPMEIDGGTSGWLHVQSAQDQRSSTGNASAKATAELSSVAGGSVGPDDAFSALAVTAGYYRLKTAEVSAIENDLANSLANNDRRLAEAYLYVAADLSVLLNPERLRSIVLHSEASLRSLFSHNAGDSDEVKPERVVTILA